MMTCRNVWARATQDGEIAFSTYWLLLTVTSENNARGLKKRSPNDEFLNLEDTANRFTVAHWELQMSTKSTKNCRGTLET